MGVPTLSAKGQG